ncbi:MAG: hypothetical protein AB8C84_09910 [Oligoflexales bacterium]
MIKYFSLLILCISALMTSCGDEGINRWHEELKRLGYIPYPAPMETSGSGLLISAGGDRFQIIANPETCFPSDNIPRSHDATTLPSYTISRTFKTGGSAKFGGDLTDIFGGIDTLMDATRASKVEIKFRNPQVEYLDTIETIDYFNHKMPRRCRSYVSRVPFIILALQIDTMEFKFQSSRSNKLSIDTVANVIDGGKFDYEVNESNNLIVKAPRYIGYHVSLIESDHDSINIFRSSRTNGSHYVWERTSALPPDESLGFEIGLDDPDLTNFHVPLEDLDSIAPVKKNTGTTSDKDFDPGNGDFR